MVAVTPALFALNGGEISPLMEGRIDLEERYPRSMRLCENWVPLPQGPVTRRPGTIYITNTYDQTRKCRLVGFEYADGNSYVLEFGHLYIRGFLSRAVIAEDPGPFDAAFSDEFGEAALVTTTYTEDELFDLQFAHSFDRLYIAHPAHQPAKLVRNSDSTWTLTSISFRDGPYLPTNSSSTATLDPAATSGGSVSLVANAAAAALINDGNGWQTPEDIGRVVRLSHTVSSTTTAGWARITAVTAGTPATTCTINIQDNFGADTAVANWRIGLWRTDNYPCAVALHQDRLYWGGGTTYPLRVDGSVVGDYELYWPYDPNGASQTPLDSDAVSFSLLNGVEVRWLVDDPQGLIVGTAGGVYLVRGNSSTLITPSTVNAVRSVAQGVSHTQPIRVESSLFYGQPARTVRELAYVFDDDGLRSVPVSLVANHLTSSPIVQFAYSPLPHSIVWMLTEAGELIGMAFEKSQGVAAWFRVTLGGSYAGGAAVVESIVAIPTVGGAYHELWLVVKRTVDGATARTIEYMSPFWDGTGAQSSAFFVDCGVSYDSTPTTTISGLGHLEGETVAVLADGAVHPDCVVATGAITLNWSASAVNVGLAYQSNFETTRIEAGAATGTAQAKTKRVASATVRMWEALGVQIGPDSTHLDSISFRTTADVLGDPPSLFSGDKEAVLPLAEASKDGRIYIRVEAPYPATIIAIFPRMFTEDRR